MKDLFGWIYEIYHVDAQVATGFDRVMGGKRADDTNRVTAGKNDLIAAARDLDNPWLAVYGRHWDLQHRLNDLNEGRTAVRDAVEAFEIAHRPENKDCPQTICSAQDLCIAYSRTDGPGYAQEVIEACESTLERIDPSWPCFDCVSAELRDGLFNSGRFEETIALIDDTERGIRSQGAAPTLGYETSRIEALIELGRLDEADAVVASIDTASYAHHSERSIPGYHREVARLRVRQGRHNEALTAYGDLLDPVEHMATAVKTLRLADELIAAGVLQDSEELARQRVTVASTLAERGAVRDALNVAVHEATAAARRGAVQSARRSLALAVDLEAHLAQPGDAPERIALARANIEAAPAEVDAAFPLTQRVEELLAMHELGDLDNEHFDELVPSLSMQGWHKAPGELLRERAAKSPDDTDPAMRLFFWLLSTADLDGAEQAADRLHALDDKLGVWAQANLAHRRGNFADCVAHCEYIVGVEPDAVNTRRLWAAAARELGDFGSAAKVMGEVVGLLDEPSPNDWWNAIVAGSLASDWQLVRRAGALLGIPFEADGGPVAESWEFCHVTFVEDNGREVTHSAQRTGPATARIVSVAFPDVAQRVNDEVVFEPIALDPRPQDDEEAAATPIRYAALVTTHSAGHHSFVIDGVAPDGGWDVVRGALFEAGNPVWMYGDNPVKLKDGTQGVRFFAAVAVGPDGSDEQLAERLAVLTANWPLPLAHQELTEAIGGDVAEHRARVEAIWDVVDASDDE